MRLSRGTHSLCGEVYAKCTPQTQQRIVRTLCEEISGRTVSSANPYGLTPLHWAAQKNFTDLTELVRAAGTRAAQMCVQKSWRIYQC